jgi:threonine dehydratase
VAIQSIAGHPEDVAAPDADELARTHGRLARWVHKTPVLPSQTLDRRTGGRVFLKCENFQRTGSFKFRGAMNALLQLTKAERSAGVVSESSGNHAQALALAGQLLGTAISVVMPRTAPAGKRLAAEEYGAQLIFSEPTTADRNAAMADLIKRHGYTLIHPCDDWRVITGQGTAALELIEEAGRLDLILCPVGGGGLLAGTVLAARALSSRTRVVGVEPEAADDACRSLKTSRIHPATEAATIADGLCSALCPKTFAVIKESVETIITVSEAEIMRALHFAWERLKIVIEPSSAVAVAPLLEGRIAVNGLRVGVILSGGNVDVAPLVHALSTPAGLGKNGWLHGTRESATRVQIAGEGTR